MRNLVKLTAILLVFSILFEGKSIAAELDFSGEGLVFDKNNLISGLHSFLSLTDKQFLNILPTCSLLSKHDEKTLIDKLKDLDFLGKDFKAA